MIVVSRGGKVFFTLWREGGRWRWRPLRLRGMDRCNRKRLKLQISICKLRASNNTLTNEHILQFYKENNDESYK